MKKLFVFLLAIAMIAVSCGKGYEDMPKPDFTGWHTVNMGVWHQSGAPIDTTYYISIGLVGPDNSGVWVHVSQSYVDNWNGYNFQLYPSHTLYVPDSVYFKYISQ